MAKKYKANTKEGALLRKYYKHNYILKLLQFNPKKNNILSYFTKDIINPLELKNYRQIKSGYYDKQILIMHDKQKLFRINREETFNFITNIYKHRLMFTNNKIIYTLTTPYKTLHFNNFNKIRLVRVNNILYNNYYINIKYRTTYHHNIIEYIKCGLYYTCIYIKNIRYRENITINLDTRYYCAGYKFTSKITYYKNKIFLILLKESPVCAIYYKPIIIIPNKYEFTFNCKLFDLLIYS
jgi:hypothetical protein